MVTSEAKQRYLGAYRRRFGNGDGAHAPWLADLRRSAIESFRELGFPTTHHEDWKYTNVAPILAVDFALAKHGTTDLSTKDLLALSFADETCNRLVFMDGIYSAQHSLTTDLPSGMRLERLADVLSRDEDLVSPWLARYAEFGDRAFVALNTAFMEDGVVLIVPENCRVKEPVYAIFVSSGAADPVSMYPRNLFVCGRGSEVKIIECYVGLGKGAYFSSPVTEISAGAGSVVDHYRLQGEGAGCFHVGTLCAGLERDAIFTSHSITIAGGFVRNDVRAVLDGEGAECMLNGLYLSDARQHIDNHTEIEHAQPRAVSHEVYKGILGGQAHGVFNGKIVVHKAAQKSDARQTNKNLLLSKDAVINSKPQLEIYADDVKCSHGSSIGQLDRDALFYLRSRGIGAEESRNLLSYAFAAEMLNKVKIAPLRGRLDDYLLTKFARTAVAQ